MSVLDDVSVIVPVYNSARYIGAAIESVLAQSTPPGELIVVDDGSTDDSPRVVEAFGDAVRMVTQPNEGIASARNRGVAESTRPLITFCDADDLLPTASLERRHLRLHQPDAPDAVYGRMEQFLSPDLDPERAARFRFLEGPQPVTLFTTGLLRREVFQTVGPLDGSFVAATDIDWMSRARLVGIGVVEIDDVVLRRRIHDENHSTRPDIKKIPELLRAVHVHRQRSAGRTEPT